MIKRVLGLIFAVVFLISVTTGCGSSKTSSSAQAYTMSNGVAADKAVSPAYGGAAEGKVDVQFDEAVGEANRAEAPKESSTTGNDASAISGGIDISQDVSNAILSERKVIRSANISVEVKDFDKAYGEINTIILGIGFIQSTNINSDKYTVDNVQKLIRNGTIVIRVDRDKFDKVLNSLKGIGEVLNWNLNGEDVTDKFFDTESRLRLLKIEESKLEEYLKKLSDLDQIFKTESRMTEIRYQIEALTGNLKKMSDLVELSTITININEKYPDSVVKPKPQTYGQKLLNNFLDSMKGVINFISELVIIVVAAVPVLVLIGLFALIAIVIYRKIPRKKETGSSKVIDETKEKDDTK